jgi:hypothetical protein
MTEVEFSRLLAELSTTAKKLNQESDSLNDLITGCEQMLADLNIGLEVWLVSNPIDSMPIREEDDDGKETDGGNEDRELGFANALGQGWGLWVRCAQYKDNGYGRTILSDIVHVKALSECSRRDRIEGLKRLPALVAAIKREADEAVKAIEAAKRLVKK